MDEQMKFIGTKQEQDEFDYFVNGTTNKSQEKEIEMKIPLEIVIFQSELEQLNNAFSRRNGVTHRVHRRNGAD